MQIPPVSEGLTPNGYIYNITATPEAKETSQKRDQENLRGPVYLLQDSVF